MLKVLRKGIALCIWFHRGDIRESCCVYRPRRDAESIRKEWVDTRSVLSSEEIEGQDGSLDNPLASIITVISVVRTITTFRRLTVLLDTRTRPKCVRHRIEKRNSKSGENRVPIRLFDANHPLIDGVGVAELFLRYGNCQPKDEFILCQSHAVPIFVRTNFTRKNVYDIYSIQDKLMIKIVIPCRYSEE